jgi:molecular chaperone GrpE
MKFDPNVHQAVANIPSDVEKGHIATVMQSGFKIGDRTLRAAMVAVSTGKSA